MKNIGIISLIIVLTVQGCSSGGDYTKDLSGGYFFRDEGTNTHDILSHLPKGKEIPADVVSYDYNNSFIVAAQKPNEVDDPLYDQKPVYKEGRNKVYYWLICHKQKLILGPLIKNEYILARKKYGVPDDIELEAPY